ncbi:peptidoglycan DD-metalloendopeptidase family protein [Salinicoccus roseus]|uniref:peptidoglycan DD-metalloendopeptidase family protein n=1 Tax=Salinicoccus roseus TaxID=45670 RepID=UPI0023012FE1|nr:peptidoglycan DD-metalloendopeptidase family protein [Salinicoccus roseus]
MAEGRIQGLSIGLGMQSAEVSRSMSEIKRSFRGLNSEAKVTSNNFKYGARDAKSYKQTIDSLSDTTEKQRKNVEALGNKYQEVVKEQGASSKAAQSLATEYNKQADNLNRLEHELSGVKSEFAALQEEQRIAKSNWTKLGNAAEKAGSKMKGIGEGMKNVGGKMAMSITAPILGGFAAVTKGTEEFRGSMATLETNAKTAGIGVDVIRDSMKRLSGVSTETDSNVEALSNLLATGFDEKGLTQTMDLLSGAVVKFPDTLKIEGLADGLQETLATGEAIGPFAELLERLGVDMDKFNGGLSDAIKNGTEQNYIMQTLADNGLGDVNKAFRENNKELVASRESQMSFQQSMSELGKTLEPIATRITQGITGIVNRFNELSPAGKRMGLIFAGIAAAIGPLITGIGIFVGALGSIVANMAPVMASIAKAGGLFSWLKLGIAAINWPITLAIAGITALGIGFTVAYNKSETFRNFISGIGEKLRNAMTWVGEFKNGILGLFKDDGMEGMDILTSIGLSQGMAQKLWDITGYFIEFKWKVVDIVNNVKGAIKGIFSLFQGDLDSGIGLLRSIGMSDDQIERVYSIIGQVKLRFTQMKIGIQMALSAVGSFLRSKIAEIVAFWKSDGQQIFQATKNIFSGISSAIRIAIGVIVPVVRTGLNVVWSIFKFVWPAILGLIKMVWGNIKGVINGGLKLIKGLIQVFSGIFTGDFRKMWEGVKNIFSGAIQFVWNLFQLMFWGRIIKGITAFIRGGLSLFRNFGSQTGKVFTNMWKRTVQIFKNLWNGSRNIFNNLKDGITSRVSNLRRSVVDGFNWMKNKSVDKFKSLVQGAKDMMTNVGKWIDRKKQAVITKATSLGTGIANAAIKGFNKLIGGINSVGKMLGINELLDKIPLIGSGGGGSRRGSGGYAPARYSTGTDYHKGGAAIVGDKGPGNGGGTSEIVSLPNGRNWLFNKETLIDDLPIGSKVMKNKKVEKKFGIGAGGAGSGTDKNSKNSWLSSAKDWVSDKTSSIVGGISGAFSNVKGFISDVWGYMKNPGELASKLVSNLNLGFDLPSTALDLAKGGVKKLTSHIGKFFGGWFDDAGGEVDGSSILGRRITAKFGKYPPAIARQLGVTDHYGLDTAHKYEKLTSPVTGRVTKVWHDRFGGNAIQIKAGELNWWFMHMQNIARKVGDMVKAGKTTLGTTGNTGLRTTGYHLHTQAMKGGIGNAFAVNPLPLLKKANSHLYGGRTLSDGLFNLHGGEYIINPNKPTEAMKLLALAGQELNGKSKQTNQLPTPGNSRTDDTIALMQQQIELLTKLVMSNERIADKELKIGDDEVGHSYDRYNAKERQRQSMRTGRPVYDV